MDIDSLTRELDRWLEDDAMRKRVGEKAKQFARERYDWRMIADRWRDQVKPDEARQGPGSYLVVAVIVLAIPV